METALNAMWDAGLGLGDRVAIVGAGVLGGLLAGLCSATPGVDVCLVDVNPERKALADHMKVTFATPNMAAPALFETGADVVFNTSATEGGLVTALNLAGVEASVIELSWYGDKQPRAPLGEAFHSRRLRLISSQVGRIGEAADHRRTRWDYHRRLSKALELLADPRYDALITEEVAFDDLPRELPRLLADPAPGAGAPGLATVVRHPGA
ncbi:MAG: zinc-binding alcohol dehydrogenase [Rhodobacteraceae bacterium]|nr:zinc-binding alcohol dehydrogenase [Paracoccaceae bacterium]